jgi:hypothetical protein
MGQKSFTLFGFWSQLPGRTIAYKWKMPLSEPLSAEIFLKKANPSRFERTTIVVSIKLC